MRERRKFVRMLERRRFVRIPDDSTITYRVMPEAKSEDFFTRNISQGGISFLVHKFIPKNRQLKIKLQLKKVPFYFETIVKLVWIRKVAHSERYEIGVEFVSLPEKATELLIAYITNLITGK